MKTGNLSSPVALGHNLSRIHPRDCPQPVLGPNFALVFEGHLFPHPETHEADKVLKKLKSEPRKNAVKVVKELEGSYVFAVACPERLIAGRDRFGTKPLYHGENETSYAIASERKALWALGMEKVKSFPPGNLAIIRELHIFGPEVPLSEQRPEAAAQRRLPVFPEPAVAAGRRVSPSHPRRKGKSPGRRMLRSPAAPDEARQFANHPSPGVRIHDSEYIYIPAPAPVTAP